MLKLRDLLNTCQNQWCNAVSHNDKFVVSLFGPNGYLKDLHSDYCHDIDYLVTYRDLEVAFWEVVIGDSNHLRVELTW